MPLTMRTPLPRRKCLWGRALLGALGTLGLLGSLAVAQSSNIHNLDAGAEPANPDAPERLEFRLVERRTLGGPAEACWFLFAVTVPSGQSLGQVDLLFDWGQEGQKLGDIAFTLNNLRKGRVRQIAFDAPCKLDVIRLGWAMSQRQGDLRRDGQVLLTASERLGDSAPMLTSGETLTPEEIDPKVILCITRNSNLRRGPSTGEAVITTLSANDLAERAVEVVGTGGERWTQVLSAAGPGYIHNSLLADCPN